MNYNSFNHHDSSLMNYQQRSQTMQPLRGNALSTLPREYLLNKLLNSQAKPSFEGSERAKYANVSLNGQDEPLLLQQSHHHSQQSAKNHQHVHTRSLSQHHYYTMYHQVDRNNYYNLSQIGATGITTNSRHPQPQLMNEETPPPPINSRVARLDSITIMQVCNELGILDSPPPMPEPRNYTISRTKGCGFFKVALPQRRIVKGKFIDPTVGVSILPGTLVTVLGPSKEDRSKFSICYNNQHIEIPHHFTHPLQPHPDTPHWNPH